MKPKNNKKIILVEDDPAIIDVYSTAFKNSGIAFEVVNMGQEAIRVIKEKAEKEENPALVLLDLILPDINGMEVLKSMRSEAKTKDIPVYVLSNQTTVEDDGYGPIKPDKFVIKANITPTQLVKLIEEKIK